MLIHLLLPFRYMISSNAYLFICETSMISSNAYLFICETFIYDKLKCLSIYL